MSKQKKRVKAGDILELEARDHFAYLHYIGKHPEYGDAVLVSPRVQTRWSPGTGDIFAGGYVAFYPAAAAVQQGLVKVVGHSPPPALPRQLRRPGARSADRVVTWVIEGDSREVVRTKLSQEELQLPIAAIWNHELLVQRIADGWTPVQEGRDA